MYEAVRTEALTAASGVHPPGSHLQGNTHHPRNEAGDAEMNEIDRNTEELEELQVGASLILDGGDPMHDDEEQTSLTGGKGNERDAYARDFEALVEFLTSADSDGGRDDEDLGLREVFPRQRAADDHRQVWVCDPKGGRVLVVKDTLIYITVIALATTKGNVIRRPLPSKPGWRSAR